MSNFAFVGGTPGFHGFYFLQVEKNQISLVIEKYQIQISENMKIKFIPI